MRISQSMRRGSNRGKGNTREHLANNCAKKYV